MSGNFTPAPRKKIALDNTKFHLSAQSPVSGGSQAKLTWGLVNNNPRITVYTGDPSEKDNKDKNYGRIQANLDFPVLFSFFTLLEEMTKSSTENNTKVKLENKNFTFYGGKRSDHPVVQSELWCGKDKDGVVWVSITVKDRPMIKFSIGPSEYHNFYNGDGSQMTKGEASSYYTRGLIGMLKEVYTNLAVTEYVDVQAQKDNVQSNRGGYNKNQNKQNYSNQSNVADDDMPF